jgi:hypothetical protein
MDCQVPARDDVVWETPSRDLEQWTTMTWEAIPATTFDERERPSRPAPPPGEEF